MPIPIGSGSISRLYTSGIGNTGPTGPTGPIGNTGSPGPTGNTGPSVIGVTGITLVISGDNRFLKTFFNNGETIQVTGSARGATGNKEYAVGFSNLGTGYSLAAGVAVNVLQIRPIEFFGTRQTEQNGVVTVSLAPPSPDVSVNTSANNTLNLIKFTSVGPNNLVGITGAYGITADNFGAVNKFRFIHANVLETARGISGLQGGNSNVVLSQDSGYYYLTINPFVYDIGTARPSQAPKTFYIDLLSSGGTAGLIKGITLATPSGWNASSNKVYTIQVIVTNSKNYILGNKPNFTTAIGNILWPNNIKPCLSVRSSGVTCDIAYTFYYVKGNIYASSRVLNTSNSYCTTDAVYNPLDCAPKVGGGEYKPTLTVSETEVLRVSNFASSNYGGTGACCGLDNECYISTLEGCDGFFHGTGTTCGTTGSYVCEKRGACCVDDGNNQICYDDMSVSDCINLRSIPGILSNFSGPKIKCKDIVCDSQIFTGACCSGDGSCSTTTKVACEANNGFYHGHFS